MHIAFDPTISLVRINSTDILTSIQRHMYKDIKEKIRNKENVHQ